LIVEVEQGLCVERNCESSQTEISTKIYAKSSDSQRPNLEVTEKERRESKGGEEQLPSIEVLKY